MNARTAGITLTVAAGLALFGLLVWASMGDSSGMSICPTSPDTTDLLFVYPLWTIILLFVMPFIGFGFAIASHARSLAPRNERIIHRRL